MMYIIRWLRQAHTIVLNISDPKCETYALAGDNLKLIAFHPRCNTSCQQYIWIGFTNTAGGSHEEEKILLEIQSRLDVPNVLCLPGRIY